MQKPVFSILALFALFIILEGCTTINELYPEIAGCKVSNGYDVGCVRNVALQKKDPTVCTKVYGRDSAPEITCLMDYASIRKDKSVCDMMASKEIAQVCKNRIS